MECMEARALKSSFSSELAMKSAQTQSIFEDIWCVTTGLQSDDFSIVDEFFDLPNEDNVIDGSTFLEEEEEHKNSSLSLSSQDPIDDSNSNSTSFSPGLAIPDDDIQELELWSHLMDDSVPEPTLACPKPIFEPKTGFTFVNRYETVFHKPVQVHARGVPFIPSAVPVKPRTKRSRSAGNRFWGLASPESSSSSTTSSSPVSTTFWFSSAKIKTPQAISDVGGLFAAGFSKPAAKRPKRKLDDNNTPVQRRCTHCQVTKTPQWRAGPNGPKTLCNACGVRFKSGRLFPEYRPACSPTFSSEVHSNSHRKVLEMRKKKEGGGTTATKLSPSSSSVTGSTSMILAA